MRIDAGVERGERADTTGERTGVTGQRGARIQG